MTGTEDAESRKTRRTSESDTNQQKEAMNTFTVLSVNVKSYQQRAETFLDCEVDFLQPRKKISVKPQLPEPRHSRRSMGARLSLEEQQREQLTHKKHKVESRR